MDVSKHFNAEKVIRYYIEYIPPHGVKSILDIGSGKSAPYQGNLSKRCEIYKTLDIRTGEKVDFVCDLTQADQLPEEHFEWGWASEIIEHIPQDLQEIFFFNVMSLVDNCVFTFPTPKHPSFVEDPGHVEVILNFRKSAQKIGKIYHPFYSQTGRRIVVISDHPSLYHSKYGLVYSMLAKTHKLL